MDPNSPSNYNVIPDHILNDDTTILDIGSGNGISQLASKWGSYFQKADDERRYLGIDITDFTHTYLSIEKLDFMKAPIKEKSYDLVIALHFVEHFYLEDWDQLFRKLKSFVSNDGYLLVACPYNQPSSAYDDFDSWGGHEPYRHLTFNIKEQHFEPYLPNAETWIRPKKRYPFWEDGKGWIYANLRYIKRRIVRQHFYEKWEICVLWNRSNRI